MPNMATLLSPSSILLKASSFDITSSRSHQPTIMAAKSSPTTFHHQHKNTPTIQIPNPSLLATIFNKVDNFICDFIDLPLPPYVDAKHILTGNLAPVGEIPPTACDVVEGSLPSCLDGGVYIRNGPNPQYFFPKGPYHFFEGDGMLHITKFSKGQITFCSRHVNTHKHAVEREFGYPFVPSIFSSFNGGVLSSVSRFLLTTARILAGQFDPINRGFGAANTNLAIICGRLFALCESDLPYEIKITAEGDVVTVGRHDFGAEEAFPRMTAHPKVDPVSGEAFAYMYDVLPPFLKLFRIDSSGRKQKDVPIFSMKGLTAFHDFAVTERYAVIPDVQIVVDFAAEIDPGKDGVHCVKAWDEDGGDKVCGGGGSAVSAEMRMEMEMAVVDVKGKTRLSSKKLEFADIN